MSYEGYEQHVCANGHQFFRDAYETDVYGDDDTIRCPTCKAVSVWYHQVDQTNGYDESQPYTYPVKLEIKEPATLCTCQGCGHTHETVCATYHIPKRYEDYVDETGYA